MKLDLLINTYYLGKHHHHYGTNVNFKRLFNISIPEIKTSLDEVESVMKEGFSKN